MSLSRRRLILIAGLVVLVAVAAVVGVVLARDGDEGPRLPGRVAVRDGCGVRHMWVDGTDQREMCLPDIWTVVSLSWNGKRLGWDTRTGIQIGNADGSNPVALQHPPGANVDPSLSPNGEKAAFLHSPRDDGRYDLWVGSTSIDNAEQLTNTRNVSSVAWSPAGDWIAAVKGWSEDTLEGDIVLIRPDGTDERLLTKGDAPTWAPGGSRLAFARAGGVWTIDADGADPRLLARRGEAPSWSRDGDLIAFMREIRCDEPVCNQRVFLVEATGGTPRAVGPTFSDPRSIVWLPDPFE